MKHAQVKKVLYRMLADQFVACEYINRTADRDPKKSLFLWSIDWSQLRRRVLRSMYAATANLMQKRRSVRKQIELLENDQSHKSSETVKVRWRKLCAAFEHLTLSLQKL